MAESIRLWQESPALNFNSAANLPGLLVGDQPNGERFIDSHNHPGSLNEGLVKKQLDSINGVVSAAKHEYGRQDEVGKLYAQTVGERFGTIRFLSGAQELSSLVENIKDSGIDIDTQPPDIKKAIIDDIVGLNKMGERLFGAIDPERLQAMIARTRRSSREVLADDPSAVPIFRAAAARRLLESLPETPDDAADKHLCRPSAELLAHYKEPVRKKYADLLALVPDDKAVYTGNELAELFEQAKVIMATKWGLEKANYWKIGRGGTNINVSLLDDHVWIPEHQLDVNALKAKQLLVHEIGTHLLRNLLGQLSGDPFLATQMAGRESDEEALCMFIQSTISGKSEESGVMHYIAIGLGQGTLDNGNPMNPHAIQSIVTDMFAIKPNSTQASSIQNGLKNTSRLVSGMPSIVIDGELHQVVHPNNIKYAQGQANAVNWFEEHQQDAATALDLVMAGKFAYSNPTQLAYAGKKYLEITGKHRVPSAA